VFHRVRRAVVSRAGTVKVRLLVASVNAGAGTARTVIQQANALADLHDVEIVSLHGRGSGPVWPVSPRVHVRYLVKLEGRWPSLVSRLPSRLIHPKDASYPVFSPASDLALWRFLRSLDSGAVMGTRPGLNLAIARWAPPGVTRIAQEHMHLASHRPRLRKAIRTYYPRLDGVVTLTERDAKDYRDLLRGATAVTAIPNGVLVEDMRRSDPESRSIVAVGRLDPQKAYDRLIDAFSEVAGAHPDWSLTIWGRGRLKAELRQQIRGRGLAERVRLAGFSSDVATELAKASVFAMSSRREGLPMSMLEAMASGLAVVSFDCPTGPRELIEDGVDGLLVPDGDIPALSAALARVMDDGQLRHRLGAAAREKAATYSTRQLAVRWSELLQAADTARGTRVLPHPRRYYPLSWRPIPPRLRRWRHRLRRWRSAGHSPPR
jgi:glycosyltransferase involved in cell wall biosynthesis